ncbi:phosphate signaling complex protein PhoU [Facklamia miroungae]|uniref:Phosphate-specific transport system accessory protein PhoU n=1 Tax=Facklamia miroungae TaxID=120956 RepID=A0A1G7SFN0_9LACT|nr:phosphate signaling complex protein PhoU [Facklamia miroungae]NKZ29667.1 phosphate signaling complex protein PhoU [Facklamia miroungae]SDG21866.1 phosphate transport system protein [Facklamia miroungae]
MRDIYIQDLEGFSNKLSEQATAVIEHVHLAINSFNQYDNGAALQLKEADQKINQLANEIEKEAYRLIALQQPVAEDLRLIFTVMSISVDLERIGDHAVLIAKNVNRATEESEKDQALTEIINKMAKMVFEMINDVLEAFSERDPIKAREIADRDELVDACLKQLYNESALRMEKNREVVNTGINYLAIGNSIERIGDYVTNICERIVYLKEAEIVDLNH